MTDYYINIFFSEEDGGYIADIPDLEACAAFGNTPAEALAEVERAKAAWIEAAPALSSGDLPSGPVEMRRFQSVSLEIPDAAA